MNYTVFDVETANSQRDSICAIGIIRYENNQVVCEKEILINYIIKGLKLKKFITYYEENAKHESGLFYFFDECAKKDAFLCLPHLWKHSNLCGTRCIFLLRHYIIRTGTWKMWGRTFDLCGKCRQRVSYHCKSPYG